MAEEKKLNPQALKERLVRHLRTADEFTRFQRYEEALIEIESALKLDPKNNYVRSFSARVKLMMKQTHKEKIEEDEPVELTLDERMDLVSKHLSIAEDLIIKGRFKEALDEVAAIDRIDPKNFYVQSYYERINILMDEERDRGQKLLRKEIQAAPVEEKKSKQAERGSSVMYREMLKEVWLDGKVTEEEQIDLTGMREWFGITMDEHKQIEREVKIEAYREALCLARRDKGLSEMEQKTLSIMREKFAISPEEQAEAEGQYYQETKDLSTTRGTIMIVDGDKGTLMSLGGMLKQQGYIVLLSHKVEEAYKLLLTQIPDLIISELYFLNSELDGISFFKKLKEHVTLRQRPFIFMSSLTDKKLVQAVLRLGADHYLSKPLDTDMLLAIVDGRLRMSMEK